MGDPVSQAGLGIPSFIKSLADHGDLTDDKRALTPQSLVDAIVTETDKNYH